MSEAKNDPSKSVAVGAAEAFRRYAPALHRYLVRRIRQGSEVADLSQEIFERFLRVQVRDAVRHPQAYLFRIASHVVSDALIREEQSPVTFDSEAVDAAVESIKLAVADDSAEIGLAQELEQALAELPDMHRAVVLLAIRDGLPHREVARRTGLTVSTVGLYVCEARARIRMHLNRS
jgi:RNA polymerase sigma factor (sigma-70 family)